MTGSLTKTASAVTELAEAWRADRSERQARTHLERDDFDGLAAAGLWLAPVPEASGGHWVDGTTSTRGLCEIYRALAAADPSVALVAAMHPAVLMFWTATSDPGQPEWEAQRESVFASAVAGAQWGTITSEPGSGGDIAKTKSVAAASDAAPFLEGTAWSISGDKHFGSGSGISQFMFTTARADGDEGPSFYVLDTRDNPFDGSKGIKLIAPWDGMGMAATQSHAMRLEGAAAVRGAWNRSIDEITMAAGPFNATLFTAVVLGVLDEAVRTARRQLAPKADSLRPYERVEWSRSEADHWLAVQAYEGSLRTIETGDQIAQLHASIRAKQSVAELAEDTLSRLTRVLGGGTFSARSPFARWFEDVRALGFLRPPWGLAYDMMFMSSFMVE